MSGFNEQDLIQFWKDANSYQSIDVPCFNIDEFKDNWVRDKIGQEALEQANGVTTGEKQCNLPIVISSDNANDSPCSKCILPECSLHCKYY